MVDIRIKDLPLEATPAASEFVPIDLSSTRRATIQTVVEIGRPAASQAEAEAGTNPTKAMTPLTTAQAIAFQAATAAQGDKADTALQPTAIGVSVQAFDDGLQSISGLTTAADQMIYTTGSDLYATTALTPFARTLLDDPDAATARATLGVTIGTNVQAFDAGLQSIAGLTTAANQMIYTTALDTYATTALTPFARTILDDSSASDVRTTLGLDAIYLRITSDPLKEFLRLGMVPNDLSAAASNATLLNTALGDIPATGGGLLVNFGNFYIADISAMPTNRPLSVRGNARGASIITPTQTTGTFFEFSQTDYTDTVDFRDFTLQFETAALCRAMSITYPAADATNNQMPHRVSGVNVDIRGLDAALYGPKSGIDLINVTGADFARVNIGGRQDTSLSGENQFFSMEYAWKSTAPSAGTPTIQKWNQCKVFACINAWDVADLHEGFHWQACEAVAVGRGIRVNLSATRPGFYINQTHISAFRECIVFNGVAQSQITDTHLYARQDATVGPFHMIFLVNGSSNIVSKAVMVNTSNPLAGGVNAIGVEIQNSNKNQVLDCDFGALWNGVNVTGTSSDNIYRKGNWHDQVGTTTPVEYQVSGSGTGNKRRAQELESTSRNSGGAVTITGGAAAATITSIVFDTLEVDDDLTFNGSILVNKDASAGNIQGLIVKTGGTSTVLFENSNIDIRMEANCAANGQIRIHVTAKARVTVRGTGTFALQAFGPVSGGSVPIDGGQLQISRR